MNVKIWLELCKNWHAHVPGIVAYVSGRARMVKGHNLVYNYEL